MFFRWKEANLSKHGLLALRTELKAKASVKSTGGMSISKKEVESSQSINKKNKKGSGSSGRKKIEAVPFSNDAATNRKRRRGLLDKLRGDNFGKRKRRKEKLKSK